MIRAAAHETTMLIAPRAYAASSKTVSGMVEQRVMTAAKPTAEKMYALLA
jgi:hypothetical protein